MNRGVDSLVLHAFGYLDFVSLAAAASRGCKRWHELLGSERGDRLWGALYRHVWGRSEWFESACLHSALLGVPWKTLFRRAARARVVVVACATLWSPSAGE